MKNVKFWLAQIAMVAIVSMIFGSPVFADPSDKGKDTRLNHANLSQGKAEWKNPVEAEGSEEPEPECAYGTIEEQSFDASGNMVYTTVCL